MQTAQKLQYIKHAYRKLLYMHAVVRGIETFFQQVS